MVIYGSPLKKIKVFPTIQTSTGHHNPLYGTYLEKISRFVYVFSTSKEVRTIAIAQGKVVGLHICIAHREPMKSVTNINMIAGAGIEGDRHSKPDAGRKHRQVLIMDRETLTEFELADGIIKENVTIEGLSMDSFQPNQSIVIGGAELEISEDCEPCARMDEIIPGLQKALRGRRGKLAQIVKSGAVELGDQIKIIPS